MSKPKPRIHSTCFIADTAVIIGDVTLEKNCGVYPHAVIRGDENSIVIKEGSNIQDCCVIHVDADHHAIIGRDVSLGHSSMIHGAVIDDECLIGIHATVLNGAHIGSGSVIGAGAVVTVDMKIPKNSLVVGVPGKVVKNDPSLVEMIRENAKEYKRLTESHKKNMYPHYRK